MLESTPSSMVLQLPSSARSGWAQPQEFASSPQDDRLVWFEIGRRPNLIEMFTTDAEAFILALLDFKKRLYHPRVYKRRRHQFTIEFRTGGGCIRARVGAKNAALAYLYFMRHLRAQEQWGEGRPVLACRRRGQVRFARFRMGGKGCRQLLLFEQRD